MIVKTKLGEVSCRAVTHVGAFVGAHLASHDIWVYLPSREVMGVLGENDKTLASVHLTPHVGSPGIKVYVSGKEYDKALSSDNRSAVQALLLERGPSFYASFVDIFLESVGLGRWMLPAWGLPSKYVSRIVVYGQNYDDGAWSDAAPALVLKGRA